jgi:hypothetical protein
MINLIIAGLLSFHQAADLQKNIALGHAVTFIPMPNYPITADGHDDSDLTNGRLCSDPRLWFSPEAVGWSYVPIARLSIDLGKSKSISAVNLRCMGGGIVAGADFPSTARLFASDDGARWYQLRTYNRHSALPLGVFAPPESEGTAWVYPLSFRQLQLRARFIGVEVSGTALTCMDELEVFAGDDIGSQSAERMGLEAAFSTSRTSVSFLKPSLVAGRGVFLPQPFVILRPSQDADSKLQLHAEFPETMEFGGIIIGGKPARVISKQVTPEKNWVIQAEIDPLALSAQQQVFGQLFLRPGPTTPDRIAVRVWISEDQKLSTRPTPVVVREVVEPGDLQGFMTSLGWYPLAQLSGWPQSAVALKQCGLNTVSIFGFEARAAVGDDNLLQRLRSRGFNVAMIDSAWHRMLERAGTDQEPLCQVPNAKHMCPAYRGRFYQAEMQRIATEAALIRPDYYFADIELWDNPGESESCSRCRSDMAAPGTVSVDEWKVAKGREMWKDLRHSIEKAASMNGGKEIHMGSYDFRAGAVYQQIWPVDALLLSGSISSVQPSVYTGLLPRDIRELGRLVHAQRSLISSQNGRHDCFVWLCPGDAGPITSEAMRCAVLECFINGATGLLFYTTGCWDGEGLLGLSDAMSAVARAKLVLQRGQPIECSCTDPAVSVNAKVAGNEVALLVGDYRLNGLTSATVELLVPATSRVIDCDSGDDLGSIAMGRQQLLCELKGHRSKMFVLKPISSAP